MSADSLSPQIVSRLLGEVKSLVRKPLEDIEYIESDDNSISEVHCYITGPKDTPYYGGKFRVKLVLQNDYPASPPRGFFLTKIYHPNVSNNGDICVNTLKKDWKPVVTLGHIFQVIRCLLIIPFPESSLNDEAGKLFMDNYEDFAKRARIMTEVHGIPVDTSEASASAAVATTSSSASAAAMGKKTPSPPPFASSSSSAEGTDTVFVRMTGTSGSGSTGGSTGSNSAPSTAEGGDENNNENTNNKQLSATNLGAKATSAVGPAGTGTGTAAGAKKLAMGGVAGKTAAGANAAAAAKDSKKKSLKRL